MDLESQKGQRRLNQYRKPWRQMTLTGGRSAVYRKQIWSSSDIYSKFEDGRERLRTWGTVLVVKLEGAVEMLVEVLPHRGAMKNMTLSVVFFFQHTTNRRPLEVLILLIASSLTKVYLKSLCLDAEDQCPCQNTARFANVREIYWDDSENLLLNLTEK